MNTSALKRSPFMELSDEDWEHDITLVALEHPLQSPLHSAQGTEMGPDHQLLIPALEATPEGGPTAISRAAGMSLTKAMASGAPHNILVNGLAVGRIDSDQWVQRHKNAGDNKSYEEWIDDFGKGLLMGRIGKAEEYAAVARLLRPTMAATSLASHQCRWRLARSSGSTVRAVDAGALAEAQSIKSAPQPTIAAALNQLLL